MATAQEPAETTNVLADPVAALEQVAHEGRELTFSLGEAFELPPGGHLQGIQMRYDAAGQRHLAFLSRTTRFRSAICWSSSFRLPERRIFLRPAA